MIQRKLEKSILDLAKGFPVIAILGPRQSGKTTLAKALFPNYTYVSLEELGAREDADHDPVGFLNSSVNPYGIIIDEFQHVPKLLSYIQLAVDEHRKPGRFILTGSQNFLMNKAITQSLAGRVGIVTLLPLSIGELTQASLLPNSIESLLLKGSYPELYVNPNITIRIWYQNYIRTYVERDVRDLKQVHNINTFTKFIRLCAARIGQIVNLSALANDADINITTVKAWLSVLETSYILFFLQPYSTQFTRRLIKSPKLFFYDTGLAATLLGLESIDDIKISPYRGNLVESLIISEITKIYFNNNKIPRTYFLRDKTGHELDCVLEKLGNLIPIEVKAAMTANKSFFDDFLFWKKVAEEDKLNIEDGFVIYAGTETQKRSYGTFLSWQEIDVLEKFI